MTRDEPFNRSRYPRTTLLLVLVAVAGALPFIGALGGPFLWDDIHLIEDNAQVHSLAHVAQFFTRSFFETGTGDGSGAGVVLYFRPLLHLSYAIDWQLGGGNPAIFHATNLLLAMVATGLVADCLMRWSRTPYWALLGTLLFAWHPTKAESVAWISGRTDLLATIFVLVACRARSKQPGGNPLWRAMEVLATIAAYASKETAVLLPVFVGVESWANRNRPTLDRRGLTVLMNDVKWQLVTACTYLFLRSRIFPLVSWGQLVTDHYSLATRAGLVLDTLGRAAQLLILPAQQSAEHGLAAFDSHAQIVLGTTHVIVGIAFVCVFVATIVYSRRRAPAYATGSALVLLALVPTSNLFPTHLQCLFYERFLYLPSIGVAFLATSLLSVMAKDRIALRIGCLMLAAVLALAAGRSAARASEYAAIERFWTHELQANPLSTTAHQGLVVVARARGDIKGAEQHLSDCHQNAVTRRQYRTAIRCAYDAATLIADSTPDLDKPALRATRDFFAAFLPTSRERTARLVLGNVTVAIDTSHTFFSAMVHELTGESFAMLASIDLKLDETGAVDGARSALQRCSRCRYALRAARVLAAAGLIDEAIRTVADFEREGPLLSAERVRSQIQAYGYWMRQASMVSGPARVQAMAQAYLALGRYGAAYDVLRPYAHEIANSSASSMQYAQIANYAGDPQAARTILGPFLETKAIDSLLDNWGKATVPVSD